MRRRIHKGRVNIELVGRQIQLEEDRIKSIREELLISIVRSSKVSFKVAKSILKKRMISTIESILN
jgi:hypothetical protein